MSRAAHARLLAVKSGRQGGMSARIAVRVSDTQPNYKVAEGPNGETLYIRKTSMRNRQQWAQIKTGDTVELSFKIAAGRSIVSDATLQQ